MRVIHPKIICSPGKGTSVKIVDTATGEEFIFSGLSRITWTQDKQPGKLVLEFCAFEITASGLFNPNLQLITNNKENNE